MRLESRIALITEAEFSDGIGRATALRFAEEGATVICLDASEAEAQATADAVTAAGGQAIAFQANVTDESACNRIAREVQTRYGGLDILYNNTSTVVVGTLEEIDSADWDRIFNVNVRPIYLMSKALLPLIRARGKGSIINLASSVSMIGYPRLPAYTATKVAVRILTRTMALDYARDRTRVNSICHGGVDNSVLMEFFATFPDPKAAQDEFISTMIPLGQLGTLADMDNAALFLASDESAGTTGSDILVDGGMNAR